MKTRSAFPQPAPHVLHVHNRIIHHHADGHGEPAERHGVHTDTEELEDQNRDRKRQRHGHERDGCGAEVQQEQEQNDRHHDRPVTDGLFEIPDGILDEIALAKQDLGGHAGWQRGLQLLQCGLDLLREFQGVKPWRFVDAEHHAHRAVHAGITAHRLNACLHLGHVAD